MFCSLADSPICSDVPGWHSTQQPSLSQWLDLRFQSDIPVMFKCQRVYMWKWNRIQEPANATRTLGPFSLIISRSLSTFIPLHPALDYLAWKSCSNHRPESSGLLPYSPVQPITVVTLSKWEVVRGTPPKCNRSSLWNIRIGLRRFESIVQSQRIKHWKIQEKSENVRSRVFPKIDVSLVLLKCRFREY